jgi:2-keto-3-deoxy-L-rhamnonate aldolase RhmA
MAIDGGAQGIIVPYVETVEQVRAVVGAVKFRPLKGEALERVMSAGEFPSAQTQA